MAVQISGMFGNDKTYFADSPVVIDISGLEWGNPVTSPFTIVRVEVIYKDKVVGDFRADTGGQTSTSFDISSALRAIWSDFGYSGEVAAANAAKASASGNTSFTAEADDVDFFNTNPGVRKYREYSLRVYTEYMASDDGGVFTPTGYGPFPGGRCAVGGLTEWERYSIAHKEDADASSREHTGVRNGDASTKPTSTPERVGRTSITSWVDINSGGTKTIFYPAAYNGGRGEPDDSADSQQGWTGHAPLVLRDTQTYVDFLFVNHRGAVETCSALMKESMGIDVDVNQYARVQAVKIADGHRHRRQALLEHVERICNARMGRVVGHELPRRQAQAMVDALSHRIARRCIRARYREACEGQFGHLRPFEAGHAAR